MFCILFIITFLYAEPPTYGKIKISYALKSSQHSIDKSLIIHHLTQAIKKSPWYNPKSKKILPVKLTGQMVQSHFTFQQKRVESIKLSEKISDQLNNQHNLSSMNPESFKNRYSNTSVKEINENFNFFDPKNHTFKYSIKFPHNPQNDHTREEINYSYITMIHQELVFSPIVKLAIQNKHKYFYFRRKKEKTIESTVSIPEWHQELLKEWQYNLKFYLENYWRKSLVL